MDEYDAVLSGGCDFAPKKYEPNQLGSKIPGEIVSVAGMECVVLEQKFNSTMLLTKSNVHTSEWSTSGDESYENSTVRRWIVSDFVSRIENSFGKDCLVPRYVDTSAMNGEYENCFVFDKAALLSIDEYRRFHKVIPHDGCWWWLATPWGKRDAASAATVSCGQIRETSVGSGSGFSKVAFEMKADIKISDK